MRVKELFTKNNMSLEDNFIVLDKKSPNINQEQTNKVFSAKWEEVNNSYQDVEKLAKFQFNWYLKLYGFKSKKNLADFLKSKTVILDAGCGLGYKSAWFAEMAPNSVVIGMDFSGSAYQAAKRYRHLKNLFFVRGDIANTHLKEEVVDYISCDQVLHHTEKPKKTFRHLTKILKKRGEFSCYVYAKKALPREMLDNYFRERSKKLTRKQLWDLSEQLTQVGKSLSELDVSFECPDIPLLGIKGGKYDVQRFIYWNFIKCFWKEEWGHDLSVATNFDWYAPSNADRYSEEEYKKLISKNNLKINYFHKEEACYSGRFLKSK